MYELLVVCLFALALLIAVWPGMMKQDVTMIKEGVQGVAADEIKIPAKPVPSQESNTR